MIITANSCHYCSAVVMPDDEHMLLHLQNEEDVEPVCMKCVGAWYLICPNCETIKHHAEFIRPQTIGNGEWCEECVKEFRGEK